MALLPWYLVSQYSFRSFVFCGLIGWVGHLAAASVLCAVQCSAMPCCCVRSCAVLCTCAVCLNSAVHANLAAVLCRRYAVLGVEEVATEVEQVCWSAHRSLTGPSIVC